MLFSACHIHMACPTVGDVNLDHLAKCLPCSPLQSHHFSFYSISILWGDSPISHRYTIHQICTLNSWNYNVRKNHFFPSFVCLHVYLYQCELMDSYFIHWVSIQCFPYLFDVLVVLDLASGSSSSWLICPIDISPSFFEHYFWSQHTMIQVHLVLSSP